MLITVNINGIQINHGIIFPITIGKTLVKNFKKKKKKKKNKKKKKKKKKKT